MQFPYLLSGDVILFQSDSPSPPLSLLSLSLSIGGWLVSSYPRVSFGIKKRKKGGGKVGSRDAGIRKREDEV